MVKQRFLVTGGAGFIGSHLVDALLGAGHKVLMLDDLSVGKTGNFAHCISNPHFQFIEGSVLDTDLVSRCVSEVDAVYHLAAVVGVKYVVDNPLHGMRVNLHGAENILEAALRHRRKVLLASTSETFGKSPHVPFKETGDTVLGSTAVPRWSYAIAKLLDEHLAFAYWRQEALPTVVVRYFNAYGPRLDPLGYGSVIARFVTQAMNGGPLTVYGDGNQTRSFTFVGDTVRGTIAAMETPAGEGMAFNIGNPREITINELAQRIGELVDPTVEIVHVPYKNVYGSDFEDTQRRLPDVSRSTDVLGFQAEIPLEEGLRKTILWFKEQVQ